MEFLLRSAEFILSIVEWARDKILTCLDDPSVDRCVLYQKYPLMQAKTAFFAENLLDTASSSLPEARPKLIKTRPSRETYRIYKYFIYVYQVVQICF